MKPAKALLFAGAWFMATAFIALAGELPEGGKDGGEIPPLKEEIEVRGRPETTEDAAAFATVLDTRELSARGEDLSDVLRRVPGARIRQYGGLGHLATLSLRSSTAEQVTILVDGVRQNRALGGPVDLSFIPATQIRRVTVYRGFGPAGAGLGGIGGLVEIETLPPGRHPGGQIDLLRGQLETTRLSTGWSMAAGERGGLRLGAELLGSQDDFRFLDTRQTPFDPSDDVTRRRTNNDVSSRSLMLRGMWDRRAGDLSLTVRSQKRRQGIAGIDSLPAAHASLEETLDEAAFRWRHRISSLASLELTADGFRQHLTFVDRAAEISPGAQDQTTRLTGGGGGLTLRNQRRRHALLARIHLRHEQASVTNRALVLSDRGGANRDLVSFTLQDAYTRRRFTLAPSLRWEFRRDRFDTGAAGLPPPDSRVAEGRAAGQLGVAYRMDGPCALRGSAGRFFRNPNLTELFGDRGFLAGNPALRPEKGLSAEAGLACETSRGENSLRLETVVFGRRVDDLIFFRPLSQATARASNLSRAQIFGLESSLSLDLPAGFNIEASGTLQRATDRSGGPADGNRLVFQPQRLGLFGVGWQPSGTEIRWEVTYVGPSSTDRLDSPSLRLPARVFHDLLFSRR
ncbi:MAG: TonB-dependent receptor plug domain-containing protein, partial [Acidobacteriota bacterium]